MVLRERLKSWNLGKVKVGIAPETASRIVADFTQEETIPIQKTLLRRRPFVSLPDHTVYEVIQQLPEGTQSPIYSNTYFQFLVDSELAGNSEAQETIRSFAGPVILLRRTRPDKSFARDIDRYSHDYHESTIALTHARLSEKLGDIIDRRKEKKSQDTPPNGEDVLAQEILRLTSKTMKFYPVSDDPRLNKAFEALNDASDEHELEYNLIMSSQKILRSLNVVSGLIVLTGVLSANPLQDFTKFAGERGSATAAVWGGDMLTQLMHKANEVAAEMRYRVGHSIDLREFRKHPISYTNEKRKEFLEGMRQRAVIKKEKREARKKEKTPLTKDQKFKRGIIWARVGLSTGLFIGDFLFAGGSLKLLSAAPVVMQSINSMYKYCEKLVQLKRKGVTITKTEYERLTKEAGGIFTKIFQRLPAESQIAQRHLMAVSEVIANKMILSSLLGTVISSGFGLSGALEFFVNTGRISRELADLFLGTILENGFAFAMGLRFFLQNPYTLFLKKYKQAHQIGLEYSTNKINTQKRGGVTYGA